MADEVNFKTGMGQPIVAYNLHPSTRKTIIEASVYSHTEPVTVKVNSWGDFYGSKNIKPIDKGQGKVATVLVLRAAGEAEAVVALLLRNGADGLHPLDADGGLRGDDDVFADLAQAGEGLRELLDGGVDVAHVGQHGVDPRRHLHRPRVPRVLTDVEVLAEGPLANDVIGPRFKEVLELLLRAFGHGLGGIFQL